MCPFPALLHHRHWGRLPVLNFSSPVASSFYPHLADQESFMALPTGRRLRRQPERRWRRALQVEELHPRLEVVLVKNPKYWNAKSSISPVSPSSTCPKAAATELTPIWSGGRQPNPTHRLRGPEEADQPPDNGPLRRCQLLLRPHMSGLGPFGEPEGPPSPELRHRSHRYQQRALLFGKGQPAWTSSRPHRPTTTPTRSPTSMPTT